MSHLNDGALRRLNDEPLAMSSPDREHFDSCDDCRRRLSDVALDARSAADLLALPDLQVEPSLALATVRERMRREELQRPISWTDRLFGAVSSRHQSLARPALVVALAALLTVGIGVTGIAQNLVKVFQPSGVVAVRVSPSGFRGAPNPALYGAMTWSPSQPTEHQVSGLAAAAAAAGFKVLAPGQLPAAVPATVIYSVIDHATGSFRFNTSADPPGIAGSTLFINTGPSVAAVYGHANATAAEDLVPVLVIGETRAPSVYSTGASAAQLENFLLSQPGFPPDLVAQIKAIKNPSSTLPIPVPAGIATSHPVDVQGVKGVLVDFGLGSGVVWVKAGIVYAVAGQLTPDQVVTIANSLR